jgi:dihydroorotate dehydrogenase electron transfer subunit
MRVATCGPDAMMAAVARWTAAREIPCEASLETPMACGIGICFTCVAPIRDADGGWDYRRTCVEGPVFDAASIVW